MPMQKILLGSVENPPFYYKPEGAKIVSANGIREIPSAFWYRQAEDWYSICAFASATRTVYLELQILQKHIGEISALLGGTTKFFYGIGNGDTESMFVQQDLEDAGYSEIVAIDANKTFLENFVEGMKSLLLEHANSEIAIALLNTTFEAASPASITPSNRRYNVAAHICLGNTVGNFDQDFIFSLFSRNARKGDFLVLGANLLSDPEVMLKMYSNNRLYNKWASHIGNCSESNLRWKWNPASRCVETWSGDLLVLKSRKYLPTELESLSEKHGFSLAKDYTNRTSYVCILKKV